MKTSDQDGDQPARRRFKQLVSACLRKELASVARQLDEQPKLLLCRDKFGRNLLHHAVILIQEEEDDGAQEQRCLDCFQLLVGRAKQMGCLERLWQQTDADGLTILHLAVISCNLSLVGQILAHQSGATRLVGQLDKEQHSALHWAVITNSLKSVQLLVACAGVQLAHQSDANGATPLHYATQTSDYPKYRRQLRQMLKNAAAALEGAAKKAEEEQGVELAASESAPGSAKCARQREEEELQILLYLTRLPGIELECRDKDARTPLLWAASSGNRRALQLLLRAGANANARDANQLAALHCAASHGFTECLECLLQASQQQNNNNNNLDIVNQPDSLNCTPLFYAVLSANIDCVELLLERGARADWQDAKGRTAAHFAALRGQLTILRLLEARATAACLWLANKQGDLPLHYAVKSGRPQLVGWLLERSPYERAVNAINNAGRAPLHLAVQRNSAPLVEFLLRRGANLNQLVRVRDKTAPGGSRYETALDMARRPASFGRCLELLEAHAAKSAGQVLAGRQLVGGAQFKALQPAGASPIGFETASGSSAEPRSESSLSRQPTGGDDEAARLPQLPGRPAALDSQLPQESGDSAGSSALSHSSLTSLHTGQQRQQQRPAAAAVDATSARRETQSGAAERPQVKRAAREQESESARPVRGGLTYQNDFMNASIKCKLYNHSFPPLFEGPVGGAQSAAAKKRHSACGQVSARAATKQQANEIITHVNVFASPVHECAAQRRRGQCCAAAESGTNSANTTAASTTTSDSETATSELNFEPEDEEEEEEAEVAAETAAEAHEGQEWRLKQRFPAPSRAYTQHLPVILSAEEERSTSGDTLAAGGEQSPPSGRGREKDENTASSPLYECNQRAPPYELRLNKPRRQAQAHLLDYSQVRAKVDSHRNDSGLSSHFGDDFESAGRRSKSCSTLSSGQPRSPQTRRPPPLGGATKRRNRSPGRASIRTRRLSVDATELASSVEKTIRKYKQETRLFGELQNLKRSQIRSGRANEALLVKRLIEQFKGERGDSLLGLDLYTGPYTYKAYELYLYDQLRKLSQWGEAKLVGVRAAGRTVPSKEDANETRDYLEEDLRAELELQRVMNRAEVRSYADELAIEPNGALEEIRVHSHQQASESSELASGLERQSIHSLEGREPPASLASSSPVELNGGERDVIQQQQQQQQQQLEQQQQHEARQMSSASSSRRSSVEVEREKLKQLPLRVADANLARIETEASDLTAAIITDALGNISRANSPTNSGEASLELTNEPHRQLEDGETLDLNQAQASTQEKTEQAEHEEEPEDDDEPTEAEVQVERAQPCGRRRSVVNIGNKVEVIYHDVGIAIEPVTEGNRSDDDDEAEGRTQEESAATTEDLAHSAQADSTRADSSERADSAQIADGLQSETAQRLSDDEANKDQRRAESAEENGTSLLEKRPEFQHQNRDQVQDYDKTVQRSDEFSEEPSASGLRAHQVTGRRASSPPALVELSRPLAGSAVDAWQPTTIRHASISGAFGHSARSRPSLSRGASSMKREATYNEATVVEPGGEGALPLRASRSLRGRSRLPSGPNLVRIPLGQVKARWREIKQRERRRMRSSPAAANLVQSLSLTTQSGEREAPAGGRRQQLAHAKSQPSLKEGDLLAPDCSNFTLIYELNRERVARMQAPATRARQTRPPLAGAHWCPARAVRIVDLRTVKRTLSLPESLLYSNDLLKRFNILKL